MLNDYLYNEKKMADTLKKFVGRTFPTAYSLEYPHGRIKSKKLLSVNMPENQWYWNVTFEATFPDGFKAEYNNSIVGFFNENFFFFKDEL